ncbi:translation initiation inhibitor [Natronococcus jeotgali DSM 18795]|uniref:Translation initiation inhibitor n=1 Tax=Natronococcus jeotgali DSM 18795 TaxID=1227498 RepID=L9XKN3_9EURY|nr:translation initiation inhibitor [Natronococcus jeotgali DSM 18795]
MTDSNVYVSGQGPVDPSSGDVIDGDVRKQARRTLENVAAVLDAADRSLDDVVKTTVFVTDMADYEAVNEVYAEYMTAPFPARSAVEVTSLPVPIDVEIEAIAE